MRKKVLILVGFGILSGLIVGNVISYLTSDHIFPWVSDEFAATVGNGTVAFLLQSLVYAIDGALCMAGVAFYDIEEWSIARATLTHYALVVLCYLMMSLLLRFNNGFWETLMMLGIMTVAFFLIWLIMYLIFRRQVRELNELNRKKAKR